MPTPQPVPTAPEVDSDTSSPNQYHLRGNGVRISYFPGGAGPLSADGPIIVVYQDSHRSLALRGRQADVVAFGNFGTCVTVTLEPTIEAKSTTATLLVPTVVLTPGRSARIKTAVIVAAHSLALSRTGHPQRDMYRVITLAGEASQDALPL